MSKSTKIPKYVPKAGVGLPELDNTVTLDEIQSYVLGQTPTYISNISSIETSYGKTYIFDLEVPSGTYHVRTTSKTLVKQLPDMIELMRENKVSKIEAPPLCFIKSTKSPNYFYSFREG